MEIYILGVIFLFVIFIGVNFTRINGFGSNSNGKNFKIKNDKLNSEINIYKGYSEPEKDIPIAKEDVQDLELPYVVLAKALNTLQTTPINKLVKSQIPPKVDIFRPETLPPNTELLVKK